MTKSLMVGAVIAMGLLVGCEGRPSLLPNSDPALRRTSTQFAADSAKRHPFKSDVPSGGPAQVNAQYEPTFGTLELLNYGDKDIDDVEIWVNRKFCVWLPKMEKGKEKVKTINFTMLFDDSGNYFWTDNGKNPIQTVELYYGGKLYSVVLKLAD